MACLSCWPSCWTWRGPRGQSARAGKLTCPTASEKHLRLARGGTFSSDGSSAELPCGRSVSMKERLPVLLSLHQDASSESDDGGEAANAGSRCRRRLRGMPEGDTKPAVRYLATRRKSRLATPTQFRWSTPVNYDYSKATHLNYQATGLQEAVGPFADIRQELDTSYHGCYTEERQRLQDAFVQDIVGSSIHRDDPWIVFTAGAMGAGKSHAVQWMSQHGYFPLPDIVQIDPDRIRMELPEWQRYVAADPYTAGALTHRESGYCVEIAQEGALRAGKHIWVDGSLQNAEWYSKVFKDIRKRYPQYRIAVFHIAASWDVIVRRTAARQRVTGRGVPEERLRASFEKVPTAVKKLAPLVDFVAHIFNDDTPELLASMEGGPGTWSDVRRRFVTLPELRCTGDGSVLQEWIQDLVSTENVVVFSKSSCPHSTRAKGILAAAGADYHAVELDTATLEGFCDSSGPGAAGIALQVALNRKTGCSAVPQIFFDSAFLGGCGALAELERSGGLIELLRRLQPRTLRRMRTT
eukprot:TRINITY_DN14368_c0_g1_i2.p1 TRINITY_DN14368_c0_g1~~TRINITY_DN14368_c0_g1_i2.p1  ORF type:complete len:524 (-),score=114.61 TRINITY_DN14368_c0_g1_i2:142-1713(-)